VIQLAVFHGRPPRAFSNCGSHFGQRLRPRPPTLLAPECPAFRHIVESDGRPQSPRRNVSVFIGELKAACSRSIPGTPKPVRASRAERTSGKVPRVGYSLPAACCESLTLSGHRTKGTDGGGHLPYGPLHWGFRVLNSPCHEVVQPNRTCHGAAEPEPFDFRAPFPQGRPG